MLLNLFNFRFLINFEVFTISTVLKISEFANEFKKVRKNYESVFKLMYIIGIHVICKKMYAVILSIVHPKDHTVRPYSTGAVIYSCLFIAGNWSDFGAMDSNWVVRWLDDIGLPQYKDAFSEACVDGRVLHYLTFDDFNLLKINSAIHQISIGACLYILCISTSYLYLYI